MLRRLPASLPAWWPVSACPPAAQSQLVSLPAAPCCPLPQDFLFEEASLLRSRELELKARLSGAPELAPVLPVVEVRCGAAAAALWCSAALCSVQCYVLCCAVHDPTLTLCLPPLSPPAAAPPAGQPHRAGGERLDGDPCGAHGAG